MPNESALPDSSLLLLTAGLFFPVVSLVTLALSRYTQHKTGRNSSAVLIPFAGPLLLTAWLSRSAWPQILIPVAWLADPGTLCFLVVLPRFAREWWNTSRFTKLIAFSGQNGSLTVQLSLHRSGCYCLQRRWSPAAPNGLLMSSETGHWQQQSGMIMLSNDNQKMQLLHNEADSWQLRFPGEQSASAASVQPIMLQASGQLMEFTGR